MTRSSRPGPDDAGITLVELIIGMFISTIIAGMTAMILINSWQTQEEVTSVSQSTNTGQLVASVIERAVRNADYIDVSADQSTLLVQTSLGGSLTCQGFHLTTSNLLMAIRSTPLGDPTLWPSWKDGVQPQGATPFLTRTGNTVSYAFDMTTQSAPVHFTGRAALRSVSTGQVRSCW
ncbi:hypothetical protein GH740_12850 [Microbacterium sp. SYP-A9085]|uniref:PilW family protein n=1 Tax=Microbacterium sp. SYP-A9085 TaxID=2664454 RepID=UPI00129ADEE6|nr:prepilin-type N-terminal cleavage/methylation domain-containing protein [Microbacterium sp. SYP-A9085]MRH30188.1 hypothetical protein [Microbacterium sp. SYP-A9085]